jgi:hypothetical protein
LRCGYKDPGKNGKNTIIRFGREGKREYAATFRRENDADAVFNLTPSRGDNKIGAGMVGDCRRAGLGRGSERFSTVTLLDEGDIRR